MKHLRVLLIVLCAFIFQSRLAIAQQAGFPNGPFGTPGQILGSDTLGNAEYESVSGSGDCPMILFTRTGANALQMASTCSIPAGHITGLGALASLNVGTSLQSGGGNLNLNMAGGTCASHNFGISLNSTGTFACAQPAFSDLSGSAACSQLPAFIGDTSSLGGTCSLTTTKLNGTVPGGTAPSHEFVTNLSSSAVPTYAQPSSSDISGLGALATLNVGTSLSSGGGNLNLNMPGGSLAAHNFATALSATGTLTGAQPAFTDISGSLGSGQLPALSGDCTTSGFSITCTKSSGVAFGTAAFVNTGTSGGTLGLLNGSLTFSGADIFSHAVIVNTNAVALPSPLTGTAVQAGVVDAGFTRFEADSFGASAVFSLLRFDGTNASRTTLLLNDQIGAFNGFGYDGTAVSATSQASMELYAAQNWTTANHGTYIDFATTPNNSLTRTKAMRIENDGGITLPNTVTGGDMGAGTLNASSLFTNGGPNPVAGTSGVGSFGEGTAPTGLTGSDLLWADSTAHRLKVNDNNGGALQLVQSGGDIDASDHVTVTHLASALPQNQGGSGTTSLPSTTGQVLSGTTGGVGSWVGVQGTISAFAVGAETTSAIWAAKMTNAGHFTQLTCSAVLTGTCTTAPEFNVRDATTPANGTATTGLTNTVGTLVIVSQNLAFNAGDTIGIIVSSAEATCTVPQWMCNATYTQP